MFSIKRTAQLKLTGGYHNVVKLVSTQQQGSEFSVNLVYGLVWESQATLPIKLIKFNCLRWHSVQSTKMACEEKLFKNFV